MADLPNLIMEWIKQGLDYKYIQDTFPNFATPILIPTAPPLGSGEGNPFFTSKTEGLLDSIEIIADSPFVGIRIKAGHPTANSRDSLTILSSYSVGTFTTNDFKWVPRYGTVIIIGGVPYTVYSLIVRENFHWYKDFTLTPINVDPANQHNIYSHSYGYYERLPQKIQPPIRLLEKMGDI